MKSRVSVGGNATDAAAAFSGVEPERLEQLNRLRLAPVEEGEVVLRQPVDRTAVRVDDGDVDLDELGASAKDSAAAEPGARRRAHPESRERRGCSERLAACGALCGRRPILLLSQDDAGPAVDCGPRARGTIRCRCGMRSQTCVGCFSPCVPSAAPSRLAPNKRRRPRRLDLRRRRCGSSRRSPRAKSARP